MGGKILIVEDDMDVQLMYSEILQANEYEIETAEDGEEGVSKFKQFNPKLTIMDSDMPKMNGYDASLEIKQIDKNAKIILITGYSKVTEKIQNYTEKEFVTVVTKPIGMEQLLDLAKKYCV